ncbi:MAG: TIGR00303 family protein [Dethiosulfovibrio peptidovorans]|nr:MAG: TIGR00303 family protein [Dethiosulfovibrio peptidovorans]
MFVLIVGSTELSTIPGLSAAGADLETLPYTAPTDADLLWWGKPRVIGHIPLDPQGHPTPAIITRAAYLEAHFPLSILRAGTIIPPQAPYIDTGAFPGKDPTREPAVPQAHELFIRGQELAEDLSSDQEPLVIAESVPGGTTTAALVLEALGYSGAVSSSGPDNPKEIKQRITAQAFDRLGWSTGIMAGRGLESVSQLGDPMQPLAAGLAAGAPKGIQVVLAGGTQMLAVAAILRHEGCDRPLTVATTCYVHRDVSADFDGIARDVDVHPWSAPLDFRQSAWPGLRGYEQGYVKEGVGAGGAVWYAQHLGVSVYAVIRRTELIYSAMAETYLKGTPTSRTI